MVDKFPGSYKLPAEKMESYVARIAELEREMEGSGRKILWKFKR